jgi:hypothetical protein
MKKLWQLLVLGCVVLAVPTTGLAQSLGLNFASDEVAGTGSALAPTDVAGVVPQANWNNLVGANGTNVGSLVYDNAGTSTPSGVTVSWSSPNTWASTRGTSTNNMFPAGPNRQLMTGYIDTTDQAAGANSVTVNNIDDAIQAPSYDVYVYFLSDSNANRGGGYTLNDGVSTVLKYGSTVGNGSTFVEDPGTDINNSQDGTYLRFRRLTGDDFTLTGNTTLTTPNGTRAPINAIQIVHRTVGPGDVDSDGDVDLTDFHTLRGNLFKTGQTEAQGDLDGGGIVDFADYRIWKRNAPPGLAASVSLGVPEPASAMMLALGAALVAFCSRRSLRWTRTR